jgi:hypothetical protein
MSEQQTVDLAADIARRINKAVDKDGGDVRQILHIVLALVAPDWRIVYGRD